jgi:serine phosphatase RsbU (regulator of sigma subunit)
MRESERPEMSTIFHLRFDPATGRGEYVRAGHPPALVRRPDGEVVVLEGRGTPPLGILEDTVCRQHPVELPAGSLLLLYTDGLIERRDAILDEGLDRLKRALAEGPTDPQACLDRLAEGFGAEEIADDVAMLAVLLENGAG